MAEDLKSKIVKLALEGDLEQSVKLAGDNITLLYDIGTYFYKLKKLEIALIFFRRILEVDPKNSSAHNYLGILLSYLKRYEEAEREYREAIRLEPGLAGYHNNLGVVLKELKRYEEAEKEHREAIRLARFQNNEVLAGFHNNLGALLSEMRRYEEAEKEYREAIGLSPGFARAHNNLGILLTDRGDLISDEIFYEEAVDEFKEALSLGLEEAEVHNNLGYTYVKLDNSNKAREEFIKALKLDPSYYKARRNLKRIDKMAKEKVPTWLKATVGVIMFMELIFSYYLFWVDKLSNSNFVTMTLFLTAFLLFLVVYPELRKLKVGPSGIDIERDGKGKTAPSEIKFERGQ